MAITKTTNGSTRKDAARERPGAGAPQAWLLRVTYARAEHVAEEIKTILPQVVRQEVTHADGDAVDESLDFSFTREADAIAAAERVDRLTLAHVQCEIFEL